MLTENKLIHVLNFVKEYSREELVWINGYISGLLQNGDAATLVQAAATTAAVERITLLYGTETGNSKNLAIALSGLVKKAGTRVKLTALNQYDPANLSQESYLFIIVSTHGEGEPPAAAKSFYDFIHQEKPDCSALQFGVLALGDTSYPLFCKTGEDINLRLEQLGGKRMVPLQKCDVDYEAGAQQWFQQVLNQLSQAGTVTRAAAPTAVTVPAKKKERKYYKGKIQTRINLNDRGSEKETWHIELKSNEAIAYQPGDALAIIPRNRVAVVNYILSLADADGDLLIETAKARGTVRHLLVHHLNICYLLSTTIKKYAALTGHTVPDQRQDLVDLLRAYPVKDGKQFIELVKILSPIAPRLYSIASSPNAHEGEVHITVSRNSFFVEDERRYGLCSDFLGDMPLNTELEFYIHENRGFRLPGDDKDIIMIGPGTGIAPMRSFLEERDQNGASGKNWLFFGEQHFITDFLYQTEIQQYLQTGVLQKLNLAWSRDQQEKIYVQHRMWEHGAELYHWLQNGAYVYISGTRHPMSIHVEETWIRIIESFGQKSKEDAEQYWEQIKQEGRYCKDVY